MSTSSDDLAILLNECLQQRDELRELNSELLQDLIEVLPYAKSWAGWDDAVVRNAEKTITKAKQLNEHPA
jgi:hypothetical protein